MRIRDLYKLPGGRYWLWGKLGLALLGKDLLSKSLIQFSVDEQGLFPLLFILGQTMAEVMKIMVTSFKRSHASTAHSVPPTLQQATSDPLIFQVRTKARIPCPWSHPSE